MVDVVDITCNGADLNAALKEFREDVAYRVVRSALRKVAANASGVLKDAAPRLTGRLVQNIALRTRFARGRGILKADVVVNTSGKRGDPGNAFYWKFVERGHKTRPSKPGKQQHEVPANPFVANTWARLQQSISTTFFSDLAAAINKKYTKV